MKHTSFIQSHFADLAVERSQQSPNDLGQIITSIMSSYQYQNIHNHVVRMGVLSAIWVITCIFQRSPSRPT